MNNAINCFSEIKNKILAFDPNLILLCIDFDGTLSKIVKNPSDANIEEEHRNIIRNISGLNGIYCCIVTGREMKDIEKRVGIMENIIYSGNHGFEVKSFYKNLKIKFLAGGNNARLYLTILKKIENEFKKIEIENLIIENKKFSLTLHYRMLSPEDASKLKKEARKIFNSRIEYKNNLMLKGGKKIIEVRPDIDWDKGKACRFISEKLALSENITLLKNRIPEDLSGGDGTLRILRFNIGDDLTDEAMFSEKRYEIDGKGKRKCKEGISPAAKVLSISSVVGNKKSLADYYIDNYKQTYVISQKIASIYEV